MTGDFSQFKGPDRQLSDVEKEQAGVVDTSSATAMSAIAQGIQTATSAFDTYQRVEAKNKKDAAKLQDREYSNQYDSAIEKLSGAVDRGEITSIQARTSLRKLKQELISQGASSDLLNKTEAQSLKTLSGKALAEGTKEEREDLAFEKAFNASAFNNPYHSDEEREQARLAFAEDAQARALYQTRLNRAKLKDQERQRIDRQEIGRLLTQFPTTVNNELAKLEASHQEAMSAPGVNPAEATALYRKKVEAFFNSQEAQVRRISQQSQDGVPVQTESALKTLNGYKELALKYIGTSEYNKEMEGFKKKTLVTAEYDVLNSDQNVLHAAVANTILGNGAQYLQTLYYKARVGLNNFVIEAAKRKDGDPPPRIEEGTPEAEAFDKVLQSNLELYGKTDSLGRPFVESAELRTQVTGLLAYTSDKLERVDLKSADIVLRRLADPKMGEFIKSEKLTGEDINNAKRALSVHKDRVTDSFQLFLKESISNEARKEGIRPTNPRMKAAKERIPTLDDFELVYEGGQVLLKGLTRGARKYAMDYNKKISGPMTRVVMADAHLSGESYSSIFNSWKERLLIGVDNEGEERVE